MAILSIYLTNQELKKNKNNKIAKTGKIIGIISLIYTTITISGILIIKYSSII